MTYVELSERLDAIGRSIPVLGLRRIERNERRVDIDDLVAIAYALGVPPVLVVYPLGQEESVEVLPDKVVDTWAALKWFTGEAPLTRPGPDGNQVIGDYDRGSWERGAVPVDDYRWHDSYLRERQAAMAAIASASDPAEGLPEKLRADLAGQAAVQRQRVKRIDQQLREHRQQMRRRGLILPVLQEELARIDDEPSSDVDPMAFGRPSLRPGTRSISDRRGLREAITDAGGEYFEVPLDVQEGDADGRSDQED